MVTLVGNESIRKRNAADPPSIEDRIGTISWELINTTSAPTETHRKSYRAAAGNFSEVYKDLRFLIEVELKELKKLLEEAGVPWTPGRFPKWSGNADGLSK